MQLYEYLKNSERGMLSRLAKKINVPPSSVRFWADGSRPIPVEHCAKIEAATNGAVTRKDLRPNDWHEIWPELAE